MLRVSWKSPSCTVTIASVPVVGYSSCLNQKYEDTATLHWIKYFDGFLLQGTSFSATAHSSPPVDTTVVMNGLQVSSEYTELGREIILPLYKTSLQRKAVDKTISTLFCCVQVGLGQKGGWKVSDLAPEVVWTKRQEGMSGSTSLKTFPYNLRAQSD